VNIAPRGAPAMAPVAERRRYRNGPALAGARVPGKPATAARYLR
jgi:hypothetical protein